MNLNELFGEKQKVTLIDDKERELNYTARGLLFLEKKYQGTEIEQETSEENTSKPLKPQKLKDALAIMRYFIIKAGAGITFDDICNLLFAGLAHTKEFKDYDDFLDLVDARRASDYANKIVIALTEALYTPEQLKKLEAVEARADAGDAKNVGAPVTTEN